MHGFLILENDRTGHYGSDTFLREGALPATDKDLKQAISDAADPTTIIEFDTEEGWSRDVTADQADKWLNANGRWIDMGGHGFWDREGVPGWVQEHANADFELGQVG